MASDVERVRRSHGLAERFVLNVATPRPHKNRAGLIEAWRRVAKEIPAAQLALVGPIDARSPTGPYRSHSADRIRYLGVVSETDLWALYRGAEVYVHPSFAEGFGLPVLEAMSCGTPVSCSDIATLVEVTDGAASLFDPRDPAALAGSIGELCGSADLRSQLARRGLERASRFSWSQIAERTWQAYREALAACGREL